MPTRDALISTGLIIGLIVIIAGLVAAAEYHVFNQIVGSALLIGLVIVAFLV